MKTIYIQQSTILIIDDNPVNLDLLCNYLTTSGAKVLVKKDGESGIETAIRKKPDIILLDIILPTINGYETCRRLKSEPITQSIPIIFISVLMEDFDKVKGFELGAVDYVTKPFQIEEVLARIETHLNLIRFQQQLQETNKLLEIANQQLYKKTILDDLTQIANRRYFDSYLNKQWQHAVHEKQSIALLICDLDYFKQYNDTYGHQCGDVCLKNVAQTIVQATKHPANLVARYGGEEFGVILPNAQIHEAIDIAETICQAIRDLNIPHEKSSVFDYVTLSLGVSCFIPTAKDNIAAFFEIADKALYQAKNQGRNQFVVLK